MNLTINDSEYRVSGMSTRPVVTRLSAVAALSYRPISISAVCDKGCPAARSVCIHQRSALTEQQCGRIWVHKSRRAGATWARKRPLNVGLRRARFWYREGTERFGLRFLAMVNVRESFPGL